MPRICAAGRNVAPSLSSRCDPAPRRLGRMPGRVRVSGRRAAREELCRKTVARIAARTASATGLPAASRSAGPGFSTSRHPCRRISPIIGSLPWQRCARSPTKAASAMRSARAARGARQRGEIAVGAPARAAARTAASLAGSDRSARIGAPVNRPRCRPAPKSRPSASSTLNVRAAAPVLMARARCRPRQTAYAATAKARVRGPGAEQHERRRLDLAQKRRARSGVTSSMVVDVPGVDAARQAQDRAAVAHLGEAEAAVAVGIDRRPPRDSGAAPGWPFRVPARLAPRGSCLALAVAGSALRLRRQRRRCRA